MRRQLGEYHAAAGKYYEFAARGVAGGEQRADERAARPQVEHLQPHQQPLHRIEGVGLRADLARMHNRGYITATLEEPVIELTVRRELRGGLC